MRSTDHRMSICALIVMGTVAAGCSAQGSDASGTSLTDTQREQARAVVRPAGLVSRATEYKSLEQLERDSTSVVVAEPVSSASLGLGTESAPLSFQVVTLRVTQVVDGPQLDEVEVFAEGSDKFPAGRSYLLFLRPQRANGNVMSVVGYMAGLYEAIGQDPELGDLFGKTDSESPGLPLVLAVKDGEVQPAG